MNIIRINSKNVFYVILSLLISTVKEAQMGGTLDDRLQHERGKRSLNTSQNKDEIPQDCPVEKKCSELGAECFECVMNPETCIYGNPYVANCTVKDSVKCEGETTFKKDYICRYCYQTEEWEHRCQQKATCSSVASPQQYYR